MIHQIKSYFKFLIHSTNKHGVHSPFVYSLITLCFNDKKYYPEYTLFKKHRHTLLTNEEEISIRDFGAGSRVFKGSKRKVSQIARVAGLIRKRQRLLFRVAKYLKVKNALELGTSLGLGTIALASSSEKIEVTTVEGCPKTLNIAEKTFAKYEVKNIKAINKTFEEFFNEVGKQNFDLIYIDGDHSGKSTINYFENVLEFVHNDSVLIFDDIYWSPEMTKAWKEIINRPEVTVSIDTFQWGFVFFRKEQHKEHFVIRI